MGTDLSETLSIQLSKAACLVLFELLTTSSDQWVKEDPNNSRDSPMLINATEPEQRVAFFQLEGALERTIPELFAANYDELLESSKRLLWSGT